MKELIIYKHQAKQIENTLRLVANVLKSSSKETCLDRDVMQCSGIIKKVLKEKPHEYVDR